MLGLAANGAVRATALVPWASGAWAHWPTPTAVLEVDERDEEGCHANGVEGVCDEDVDARGVVVEELLVEADGGGPTARIAGEHDVVVEGGGGEGNGGEFTVLSRTVLHTGKRPVARGKAETSDCNGMSGPSG